MKIEIDQQNNYLSSSRMKRFFIYIMKVLVPAFKVPMEAHNLSGELL